MNSFAISSICVTITCSSMATLMLCRRNNTQAHKIWILLCLVACFWGVGGYGFATATSIKSALLWWQVAYVCVIFAPVVYSHFVFEWIGLKRTKLIASSYILGAYFYYQAIFSWDTFLGQFRFVFNQFYTIDWMAEKNLLWISFFSLYWCILLAYTFYHLLKEYKKSTKLKHDHLKFFIFATGLALLGGHTYFLLYFRLDLYPHYNFVTAAYPVAMGYSMLRHQLMDIRVVIKKGLLYTVLVSVITLFYIFIVILSEKLFQGVIGYTSLLVSILAGLTIAVIFIPMRNYLQTIIDNHIFKGTPIQIAEQNELLIQEITQSEKLKAIATLASGMAHEIKNPLTAIKTFSEHLPKKLEDKEFLIKFARLVGNEVNRVDELVHQLLEFARPAPLSLINVDLHKLLNETLELQNNAFIEHHITVNKNFDTETPLHINADANQLKQAFLNLALNAIEAMPNGGSLTVGVRVQGLGDRGKAKTNKPNSLHPNPYTLNPKVSITIKDTGTGIDKEAQKHIFEPFYSNKDNGTGLGLSITYGIIQEHHGKITVSSKPGSGTNFIISLPIK